MAPPHMTGLPESKVDAHGRSELERVLSILRRRAGIIALCAVVVGGAALGASLLQEKEYEATASLLFRDPGFADAVFGTNTQVIGANATREAATNEQLVGLDVVAARTARALHRVQGRDRGLAETEGPDGLAEMTADDVQSMISVSGKGESDIVNVTSTSTKPVEARLVANTFARQFIAFRAEADRTKLLQAKLLANREFHRLPADERDEARGMALSRAAERLGVLASLQTGNAELVQHADLPVSPSSPKPGRNTALGLLLGLLLGIGLAFLLEQLNRRLRTPEEAREAFGLPVLGTIPDSKAIHSSNQGLAGTTDLPFAENEAFRMLHASLRYFNVDRDVRSVLLTSEAADIGKSTIAWNLARVASTSLRAILVESDLRSPGLARQHGLRPHPGLAELLTHQVSLEQAIQAGALATVGMNGSGATHTLDVIASGAAPPNPAELLESAAMKDILARLAEGYDLVVIDTAPLSVVSDAYPLLRHVDGVIVVARMGRTTSDAAERMRERLERLDATPLGIVANAVRTGRRKSYGYGQYGYGRGRQPEGARPPSREVEPTAPSR
jgi:capsular exopolysaccharide synthesis family protein